MMSYGNYNSGPAIGSAAINGFMDAYNQSQMMIADIEKFKHQEKRDNEILGMRRAEFKQNSENYEFNKQRQITQDTRAEQDRQGSISEKRSKFDIDIAISEDQDRQQGLTEPSEWTKSVRAARDEFNKIYPIGSTVVKPTTPSREIPLNTPTGTQQIAPQQTDRATFSPPSKYTSSPRFGPVIGSQNSQTDNPTMDVPTIPTVPGVNSEQAEPNLADTYKYNTTNPNSAKTPQMTKQVKLVVDAYNGETYFQRGDGAKFEAKRTPEGRLIPDMLKPLKVEPDKTTPVEAQKANAYDSSGTKQMLATGDKATKITESTFRDTYSKYLADQKLPEDTPWDYVNPSQQKLIMDSVTKPITDAKNMEVSQKVDQLNVIAKITGHSTNQEIIDVVAKKTLEGNWFRRFLRGWGQVTRSPLRMLPNQMFGARVEESLLFHSLEAGPNYNRANVDNANVVLRDSLKANAIAAGEPAMRAFIGEYKTDKAQNLDARDIPMFDEDGKPTIIAEQMLNAAATMQATYTIERLTKDKDASMLEQSHAVPVISFIGKKIHTGDQGLMNKFNKRAIENLNKDDTASSRIGLSVGLGGGF